MLGFVERTKQRDKFLTDQEKAEADVNSLYTKFLNLIERNPLSRSSSYTKYFPHETGRSMYIGFQMPYPEIKGVVRYVFIGVKKESNVVEHVIQAWNGRMSPIIVDVTGYTDWPDSKPDHQEIYRLYPDTSNIELIMDGTLKKLEASRAPDELKLLEDIARTVEHPTKASFA